MEQNPVCPALPVFNIASFLENKNSETVTPLCKSVAQCLRETGALVIRDPRVDTAHNDKFIDLMEKYFSQPTEVKMLDVRSELAYQVWEIYWSLVLCSPYKICHRLLFFVPFNSCLTT